MLYDLNIPWSPATSAADLERTLVFLSELNYNTVALNQSLSPPLPSTLTNPVPIIAPTSTTSKPEHILRRCTLTYTDPQHNPRLPDLARHYDIVALRPTTEKAWLAACTTVSSDLVSLISLDLTQRYTFFFKNKHCMTAIRRGILIELCYAQGMGGGSRERANFLGNVHAIVRATGGRGLVISSGARNALQIRGADDVRNLLAVWGVGGERAGEGVTVNPRLVVVNEGIRRSGFRGIIDVVENGKVDSVKTTNASNENSLKGDAGGEKQKGKRGPEVEMKEGVGKKKAKKGKSGKNLDTPGS